MQINVPECTWVGANDRTARFWPFLPALIYSAGENIPAIRVSASSVYVGPPRTPRGSSPIGMSLRVTTVRKADEILKRRFYSVRLTTRRSDLDGLVYQ